MIPTQIIGRCTVSFWLHVYACLLRFLRSMKESVYQIENAESHSLTQPLTHPPTHSLTYPPTHPPTHSLTHSLTHPPTHPPTHNPPTHSPIHSFIHSFSKCQFLFFCRLLMEVHVIVYQIKGTKAAVFCRYSRYCGSDPQRFMPARSRSGIPESFTSVIIV